MNSPPDRPPTLEVDVAEPCPDWGRAVPEVATLAARAARAALAASGVVPAGAAELAIVFANDATVRALNRRWRGRDAATNVLSFASGAAPPGPLPHLLGDVVLAYETVRGEAVAQGKPLADHVQHLVVHGVLHLIGFDHVQDAEAERMEELERRVLAGLGVGDPYRLREAAHG